MAQGVRGHKDRNCYQGISGYLERMAIETVYQRSYWVLVVLIQIQYSSGDWGM